MFAELIRAMSSSKCSTVIFGRGTGVGLGRGDGEGRGDGDGVWSAGDVESMADCAALFGSAQLESFGAKRKVGRKARIPCGLPDTAGAVPGEYEGSLNQFMRLSRPIRIERFWTNFVDSLTIIF